MGWRWAWPGGRAALGAGAVVMADGAGAGRYCWARLHRLAGSIARVHYRCEHQGAIGQADRANRLQHSGSGLSERVINPAPWARPGPCRLQRQAGHPRPPIRAWGSADRPASRGYPLAAWPAVRPRGQGGMAAAGHSVNPLTFFRQKLQPQVEGH